MAVAAVLAEYNPLHAGHRRLLQRIREELGPDTVILCIMSGNFVQRGDFAIVPWQARAAAAVDMGANLILELPLPWAISSAEGFARGAVLAMSALGCVTHMAFGCECGTAAPLLETADCLNSRRCASVLRSLLDSGRSYAACRQESVHILLGPEHAALLECANNNLGVEYCRALLSLAPSIRPLAIRREGAGHDGGPCPDGTVSASWIRTLLHSGAPDDRESALAHMTPVMAEHYRQEETAGRAPVFWENCQRSILYRLRTMTEEEYAALDTGKEGLWHRLYRASRQAATLPELLTLAKTRRHAHARLRRMILHAWLDAGDCPAAIPCLRLLAADTTGRRLLASVRHTSTVPILTKPSAVRNLPQPARELAALEARAEDLYALAFPELSAAVPGRFWRSGPLLFP